MKFEFSQSAFSPWTMRTAERILLEYVRRLVFIRLVDAVLTQPMFEFSERG